MINSTCCFTGHRTLPANQIEKIVIALDREVESLIAKGITNFISGGAVGFDQMAAALIITKKEMGKPVRLLFALPCKGQDRKWSEKQRKLYRKLLARADEIMYVSDEYSDFCMRKRNDFMVERSAYCICALLREKSETGRPSDRQGKEGFRL